MTAEEKYEIESRLYQANKIEQDIELIKTAIEIIDSGKFYLNASRFQLEHETVARAMGIIMPSINDVFNDKIKELEQELEAL